MATQDNSLGQFGWITQADRGTRVWGQLMVRTASIAAIATTIAVLGVAPQGLTQQYETVPPLPAGAMPVPSAALPQAPTSGQQYVIYVTDTSDATLSQVRTIEPTAFITTFQGQSVIQAGRFSMTSNAQQRVTDLAALGVSAEMAQVAAATPSYAQTATLPANVYASNGDLPPLPDVALAQGGPSGVPVPTLPASVSVAQVPPSTSLNQGPPATSVPQIPPATNVVQVPPAPGNVEFGQQLNYSVPPAPNSGVALPPPTAAPVVVQPVNAPYYVVIPTSGNDLGNLANQVIQLGTPPDRVQARTEPLGPNVAVGPFTDIGLANRWNDFYRQAGIGNSRVVFQR